MIFVTFSCYRFQNSFHPKWVQKNSRKSIYTAIFETFLNLWLTPNPSKRWILAQIPDRSEHWPSNGSSVNQRFKNVPKITQETKISQRNKSRYRTQTTFEETFSAIDTDIKDFEFEIPNDGLSRISETRISDLKQKPHKKWNLDFSYKNRNSKVRQIARKRLLKRRFLQ